MSLGGEGFTSQLVRVRPWYMLAGHLAGSGRLPSGGRLNLAANFLKKGAVCSSYHDGNPTALRDDRPKAREETEPRAN